MFNDFGEEKSEIILSFYRKKTYVILFFEKFICFYIFVKRNIHIFNYSLEQ